MAEIALLAGAAVVSAAGTIAGGYAEKAGSEFQARQLDIRADEERAASQREAMEIRQNKDLVLSRGQAVAAGSGLGATDPTVLEIAGDVAQRGEYQAGMARYGGEERARGARAGAAGARFEGKQAVRGAYWKAAGTILSGASNMFAKYGGGGPPADSLGGGPMDIRPSYLQGL